MISYKELKIMFDKEKDEYYTMFYKFKFNMKDSEKRLLRKKLNRCEIRMDVMREILQEFEEN